MGTNKALAHAQQSAYVSVYAKTRKQYGQVRTIAHVVPAAAAKQAVMAQQQQQRSKASSYGTVAATAAPAAAAAKALKNYCS